MSEDNVKEKQAQELQFRVDAGLLFQLGEQLVARRSVALAELVKNAYDADATRVTILLENVTKPHGTFIVEDNGVGMTFEQIRDNWMRIATNDKVNNPVSPVFGRPRTGAKGIGRFAVRRLANKLVLHSVAKGEDGLKVKTVVEFDWRKSFKSGQILTDISVPYRREIIEEDEDNVPTGVMLYLEDARDIWDEEDIVELQRDIFSLVSPFPQDMQRPTEGKLKFKTDPGFSIKIEFPEFPSYEGEIGEQFLSAAWGELTGDIHDDGIPHYHLEIRSPKESLDFTPTGEVYRYLTRARLRLHFFVYRTDLYEGLAFNVRDAQRMGREQGGIRIYLDGFRVFPYGDPGDDWLGLDKVRAGRTRRLVFPSQELQKIEEQVPGRPYLLTPGNNQVFGVVSISRLEHPEIGINVSRERLVENETFELLRRFVQLGIYWMTIQYARVKFSEDEKRKQVKASTPSISEIINQAQERLNFSDDLPNETRRELLLLLDYVKERAQAEQEEHISELSLLRVISSTGAMVSMINHQLRAVVDGIRAIHTDLSEIRSFVSTPAQQKYDEILGLIQDWREMVTRQVSQLGFLLGPDARLRRRRLPLKQVITNVTVPLSLYMRDFGIEFSNDIPPNLRTPPIFEAELHAVLLQIFTNALKAIREKDIRKIAAKAYKDSDSLHILMYDTGVGIDLEKRDEVFKPFVTTSAPDPILGVGTGLGLWIVNDILETYAGTARFIETEKPWQTCIEIILPNER